MKRISRSPDAGHSHARPLHGLRAVLAALLLLALGLAGCADLTLPEPSPTTTEAPKEQPTEDLAKEAEGFWSKGDYPLSELLYSRLLERGDLDRDARAQALDRLAVSALKSRHYYQAKQALDRRAASDQSVLATWKWHDLYLKTLGALGRPDLLENHQTWLAAHTELPFLLRAQAATEFSEIYARGGDGQRAVTLLAETHRSAPDNGSKASFEAEYATRLRDLPQNDLLVLVRAVSARGVNLFPHALIQREAARRGLPLRPLSDNRPALAPASPLATATTPVLLAQAGGKAARSDQPAALLPTAAGGQPVRIALALPLSGRFAATGQKVLRGAAAAQSRLASQGRSVAITAINSDAPNWRQQIADLPPEVTVLGGPLMNPDAMRSLAADGTLARRAVFAFLPSLDALQEGRQAWRFYPSSRDQVRALLNLTADKEGIRSVAVLAPKNAYGQHMAELFVAEAKAKGLRLAANEYYPPDDHPRWLASVSRVLRIPEGFRRNKNTPLPMPDFGAVFMPEDWSQSELLASNFHFFEGQHLLFLGTNLWSVALDNAREVDDTYFQLAACPGAWWPETDGARALQEVMNEQALGQADFWVALGYDFVRLAARLDIRPGWTPADVNAALAAAQNLDYSLAAMHWDAQGRASEDMFLFTPRKEGKALVDPDALRENIAKARDRREKRLSHSKELQKTRKSGPSGSLTKDVQ
jgi:hypothetical protein